MKRNILPGHIYETWLRLATNKIALLCMEGTWKGHQTGYFFNRRVGAERVLTQSLKLTVSWGYDVSHTHNHSNIAYYQHVNDIKSKFIDWCMCVFTSLANFPRRICRWFLTVNSCWCLSWKKNKALKWTNHTSRCNFATKALIHYKDVILSVTESHCGDTTVIRPPYLHNRISCTGKTSSYWIRAQGPRIMDW